MGVIDLSRVRQAPAATGFYDKWYPAAVDCRSAAQAQDFRRKLRIAAENLIEIRLEQENEIIAVKMALERKAGQWRER